MIISKHRFITKGNLKLNFPISTGNGEVRDLPLLLLKLLTKQQHSQGKRGNSGEKNKPIFEDAIHPPSVSGLMATLTSQEA